MNSVSLVAGDFTREKIGGTESRWLHKHRLAQIRGVSMATEQTTIAPRNVLKIHVKSRRVTSIYPFSSRI